MRWAVWFLLVGCLQPYDESGRAVVSGYLEGTDVPVLEVELDCADGEQSGYAPPASVVGWSLCRSGTCRVNDPQAVLTGNEVLTADCGNDGVEASRQADTLTIRFIPLQDNLPQGLNQ